MFVLDNSTFYNNSVSAVGGAVRIDEILFVYMLNSIFEENYASEFKKPAP